MAINGEYMRKLLKFNLHTNKKLTKCQRLQMFKL
jgi:hypothetical protein